MDKSELKEKIKTWENVNPYITRKAKKELRELEKIEKPKKKPKPKKVDYDLNNDGKVDEKDVSLMAKGLKMLGGKKKNKKGKKPKK